MQNEGTDGGLFFRDKARGGGLAAVKLAGMRYLLAVCCALAVISAQAFYGGAMRPVFALPALLGIAVIGLLGVTGMSWRNVPPPSVSCVLSVIGFAGWMLWREQGSPDAWLAGGYLRLTLGCLVIYLIFACVITNPLHRMAFVGLLFLAAVVQAAAAAWQFARPETPPMLPWLSEQLRVWYEPKRNWRGHGSYLNGNHLAWFLNMAGIMALSVTCWGRWGLKVKILCLYVALASFAGSLVTLSRGGLLSLGAAITVFLLLSAVALAIGVKDRRFVALLVLAATVTAAGCIGFFVFKSSFTVQQRFEQLVSDDYRPAVFEAVWRQAQLDPVLGTGAGSFLYYGREYREMLGFSDDVYAHNDWMQIVADFGFPSFVFLVWLVYAHASAGFRWLLDVLHRRMTGHSRPQSHSAALLIGALACFAAFVVHSFFDFNMQIPANALLASACLGMLANSGMAPAGSRAAVMTLFRRAGCVASGAAALWLLVLVWKIAPGEFFWLKAENALLQGDLQGALIYAHVGLNGPEHTRLRRTLGETYLQAAQKTPGRADRAAWARLAARELESVARAVPRDGRNALLLAEARKMAGQIRLAEDAAIEAILRSPTQGRPYEFYAGLLEEEGRLGEAKQAYLVAAFLPGNLQAWKTAWEVDKKLLILSR